MRVALLPEAHFIRDRIKNSDFVPCGDLFAGFPEPENRPGYAHNLACVARLPGDCA
jgi:hypothetical protein